MPGEGGGLHRAGGCGILARVRMSRARGADPFPSRGKMDTYFASPERSSPEEIVAQGDAVSPVVTEVLEAVGGMLAILNENRQVLAVNATLMRHLGIEDSCHVMGLRPGEVLGCIHANEEPGGCGTSRFCRTCGAAVAMVTAAAQDRSVERTCAISTREGGDGDLFLRVRCTPMERGGQRMLVLFLQDITREQKLSLLERVFFHDVRGLMTGILGAADLLKKRCGDGERPLAESLGRMAERLAGEIVLQSKMEGGLDASGVTSYARTSVRGLFQEVEDVFRSSPLRSGRVIAFADVSEGEELFTDSGIVVRVLKNMVTNALEASAPEEEVRVGYDLRDGRHVFSVWNAAVIDPDVAMRVFQRNFSTKSHLGRGMGTWSMKFFGEQILHGEVDFRSSKDEGTTFFLILPG